MKLIAKKYAKALYTVAMEEPDKSEDFHEGLAAASALYAEPTARKILKSPVMPADLKRDLLYNALQKTKAPKVLSSFIDILVTAQRVELLPDIIESYHELSAAALGQQSGVLTSAVKVSDSELAAVESELARIFKKKIILENRVDAALLGGYVIRVGNSVIDQSITSKIKALAYGLQNS